MNLHDWIDEVCDLLDIDHEADEGLVLDLARVCAHGVQRPAAPVTTYLLGYAAGARGLDPTGIEALADAVTELADRWDRPVGSGAGSEAGTDGEPDPEDDETTDATLEAIAVDEEE